MRVVLGALAATLLLVAAAVAASYLLIESGEVVVLRTREVDGAWRATRLWVVDLGGAPWIGTADPSRTRWYPRLLAHPEVELERAGVRECRIAVPVSDPAARARYDAAYEAKYGAQLLGSRVLRLLGGARSDPAGRFPVRLDACPPAGPPA